MNKEAFAAGYLNKRAAFDGISEGREKAFSGTSPTSIESASKAAANKTYRRQQSLNLPSPAAKVSSPAPQFKLNQLNTAKPAPTKIENPMKPINVRPPAPTKSAAPSGRVIRPNVTPTVQNWINSRASSIS